MTYRVVPARYDYGVRKGPALALAIHMTEGDGSMSDVNYLANQPLRGVSVHYVIVNTGEIIQMLPESHASGSINPNELRTTNDAAYTSPDGARVTYGASVRRAILGVWDRDPNSAVISCEVGGHAVDGPNGAQSAALAKLVADVRTRHAGIATLGHRDFTSTKACPGHKVRWASLGGHGKPVFAPPPQAPEDPMGVSIKLGSTASGDPLASFGIATLKGGGHDLISVATSAVVGTNMPDGYSLGVVEKGTLAKATGWGAAGEAVVTYNVDGAQAVSPLRDVTFTPMAPPPAVTPVARVQTLDASGKVLNEFRPVTA
jgi:hypothetical protein